MTDTPENKLHDRLADLMRDGYEDAQFIPEQFRRELIGLWSAQATTEDLLNVYLQPFPASDDRADQFTNLTLQCFHRYSGDEQINTAHFLKLLDAHIWSEIENQIDDHLAEVRADLGVLA